VRPFPPRSSTAIRRVLLSNYGWLCVAPKAVRAQGLYRSGDTVRATAHTFSIQASRSQSRRGVGAVVLPSARAAGDDVVERFARSCLGPRG